MSGSKAITSIEFYGKHAEIIEKISVTQESSDVLEYNKPPLFNRILDSMFVAGLIGLLSKRKGEIDKSTGTKKTIFSDTVSNNLSDINFYSAIPIIKGRDLSKTVEVKRALFTEGEENYYKQRLDIFYAYVLGGLELIDERVLQHDNNEDDVEIFSRFEELLDDLCGDPNGKEMEVDLDFDFDLNVDSDF